MSFRRRVATRADVFILPTLIGGMFLSDWPELAVLWAEVREGSHVAAAIFPPPKPRSSRGRGDRAGANQAAGVDEELACTRRRRSIAASEVASTAIAEMIAIAASPCVKASRARARSSAAGAAGSSSAIATAPPRVSRAASAAAGGIPGGAALAITPR